MIRNRNINRPDILLSDLKENNQKFELIKTTSTTKLVWNSTAYKYSTAKILKLKEVFFLKKVLKYVTENVSGVHCDQSKISYIRHGRIKNNYNYKKDIYEIDLNAAYWNFALTSGYISKELHREGLSVSKMCRLVSLGNLAKTTTIMQYNGKEFKNVQVLKSESTQGVFFDVSRQTDDVMKYCRVIANENFLFYWVDAIFIQGKDTLKNISDYLKFNNIDFKVKEIDLIKKKSNNIEVYDNKGKRNFTFKKQ